MAIRCCRPSYAAHTLAIGTYTTAEVFPINYDNFEIFKKVVGLADLNTSCTDPERSKYDHADLLADSILSNTTTCSCSIVAEIVNVRMGLNNLFGTIEV